MDMKLENIHYILLQRGVVQQLKKFLFNYITNDGDAHFSVSGTFSSPNGNYGASNYIVSDYTGDRIIVKLPYQII